MNLRISLALVVGLLITAIGAAQKPFPDIPDNHWVFEDLSRLRKEGLMVGYPDGLYYPRHPANRSELAISVRTCFANAFVAAKDLMKKAMRPSLMSAVAKADRREVEIKTQLKELKSEISVWQPPLTRLIKEFSPELKTLGADPNEMLHDLKFLSSEITRCQVAQPGSALVQFSDVPADHWAAKQVLELRRLGILQGYPAGGTASTTFNRSANP